MSDRIEQEKIASELETIENQEWLESLDYVLHNGGSERVKRLLQRCAIVITPKHAFPIISS